MQPNTLIIMTFRVHTLFHLILNVKRMNLIVLISKALETLWYAVFFND